MVEWSLGGHLSEVCPTTPAANQDGQDFLDIDQSETIIACGGHVC
jgi:hypothetical protein